MDICVRPMRCPRRHVINVRCVTRAIVRVNRPGAVHYLQQWFAPSDPAMEQSLHNIPVFRQFAALRAVARLLDETTILRFRHLLEKQGLATERCHFGHLSRGLEAARRIVRWPVRPSWLVWHKRGHRCGYESFGPSVHSGWTDIRPNPSVDPSQDCLNRRS